MEAVKVKQSQVEELRAKGMLGCADDPMWDGKMHRCCGATRAYYHKATCGLVTGKMKLTAEDRTVKNEAGNVVRYNKHLKRKNNDIVAAMYVMYINGNEDGPVSIAGVAKIYKRSRQAVWDVFRSRGYVLRSKKLKGLIGIGDIWFTETKGGYLRGTIPGRGRMMAQHYVWEREHGGEGVPEGYVIMFKDGNKRNVVIENLELVLKKEMPTRFNPHHNNQNTKSKVI